MTGNDVHALERLPDLVLGVARDRPSRLDGFLEVGQAGGDVAHLDVDIGLLGVERAGADTLPGTFQAVDRPLQRLQLTPDGVESCGELALELEQHFI